MAEATETTTTLTPEQRFIPNFAGEGGMKNVDLVVHNYGNSWTNEATGNTKYYLEVAKNVITSPTETRASLVSQKQEKNGKTVYNRSADYTLNELERIKEAAGANVSPILDKDGNQIGESYSINADVHKRSDGRLGIDPKGEIKQGPELPHNYKGDVEFPVTRANADKIREAIAAAKEQAAQAEAPAAEAPAAKPAAKKAPRKAPAKAKAAPAAEAEAPAVENDGPEL